MKQLDSFLEPLDFRREKKRIGKIVVWNRQRDGITEAIGLQKSSYDEKVTINIGILDTEVYEVVWERKAPTFVDPSMCTITTRVGKLLDGLDKWWQLEEPDVDIKIEQCITDTVLPFLEKTRSRKGAIHWFVQSKTEDRGLPQERLSMAVMAGMEGDFSLSKSVVEKLKSRPRGAWDKTIESIAKKLA